MTTYRVSQDGLVTGVSIVSGLVLVALAVSFGVAALSGRAAGWYRTVYLVVSVCAIGLLLGTWAYHPQGYEFADHALLVRRPAGAVVLPLDDVRSVRADPTPFAGSVRVAGNGGLFGFWGRFYSQRLNRFTAYATRRDRGVVLDLGDRRIVVTPDEPDRLVADITRRVAAQPAG